MKLRNAKIIAFKEIESRKRNRKSVFKTQLKKNPQQPQIILDRIPVDVLIDYAEQYMIGPEDNPENATLGDTDENRERRRAKKMTDHVKVVEALRMTGNLSENWRRFKRNFDIFMNAAELTEKSDLTKVSTLLNAVGEEAVDVFDSFNLSEADRVRYDAVVKAFADFCTPKKNEVYERYVFYQRKQKEGELFDSFLMDIKKLVRTCGFADENQMLRDQIVMGIGDKRLQTRLLEIKDLSYDTAVEKCRTNEVTREQASTMSNSNNISVHEVQNDTHTKNRNTKKHTERHSNNNRRNSRRSESNAKTKTKEGQQQQHNSNRQQQSSKQIECTYCGLTHKIRECPAYGKFCNKCSRKNHFSSVCKSRNVAEIVVNNDDDCDNNSEFYIGTISYNSEKESVTSATEDNVYPWKEKIEMNGGVVPSKVDTGAELNVLPLNALVQLPGKIEMRKTGITLRGFGGQKVMPIGMCTLPCKFGNKDLMIRFAVVDLNIAPIIGLKTCIDLGIVKPSANACIGRKVNTA